MTTASCLDCHKLFELKRRQLMLVGAMRCPLCKGRLKLGLPPTDQAKPDEQSRAKVT